MTASPSFDKSCLPQPSDIGPLISMGALTLGRMPSSVNRSLPSLELLRSRSPQSFGYRWWEFWQRQRLPSQNHDPNYDQWTTGSYQASLHVLTGYASDTIGIAELYAFLLGSERDVISVVICLNRLSRLARAVIPHPTPSLLFDVGGRLYRAYRRGRHSWFELRHWQPQSLRDLPLEYVRRWFRILA